MSTQAGKGEHHYYLLNPPNADQEDMAPFEPRKHYLGIDAVRWYVNKQGNFLRRKMASGTCQLNLADETYEVGLGVYQLQGGARTAPFFEQPILGNRIFRGGGLTFKVFVRAIEEDSLLGGLLRDMAKASLAVVAGALGAATVTGPSAILLEAGASLTKGAKKILNEGKNAVTVFDPEGVDVSLELTKLRGPTNYLLIHRGMELDGARLSLKPDRGGVLDVFKDGAPLDDGAWILFKLRREDKYGSPRPWEKDARNIRNEVDNLLDRWKMGGIQRKNAETALTPTDRGGANQPSLGDRVLAVVYQIRADHVLAEREATNAAGELLAVLELAREAVKENKPEEYTNGRENMVTSLYAGVKPLPLTAKIFAAEAVHLAKARSMTLVSRAAAPDLVGNTLWRTLRYVRKRDS